MHMAVSHSNFSELARQVRTSARDKKVPHQASTRFNTHEHNCTYTYTFTYARPLLLSLSDKRLRHGLAHLPRHARRACHSHAPALARAAREARPAGVVLRLRNQLLYTHVELRSVRHTCGHTSAHGGLWWTHSMDGCASIQVVHVVGHWRNVPSDREHEERGRS